jgi:hypothetical protein
VGWGKGRKKDTLENMLQKDTLENMLQKNTLENMLQKDTLENMLKKRHSVGWSILIWYHVPYSRDFFLMCGYFFLILGDAGALNLLLKI